MALFVPFVWELWILAFWWSTWTLADTYLIPYTPVSECLVLLVCMLTLLIAVARQRAPAVVKQLEAQLAVVTHTHPGTRYGEQVDTV